MRHVQTATKVLLLQHSTLSASYSTSPTPLRLPPQIARVSLHQTLHASTSCQTLGPRSPLIAIYRSAPSPALREVGPDDTLEYGVMRRRFDGWRLRIQRDRCGKITGEATYVDKRVEKSAHKRARAFVCNPDTDLTCQTCLKDPVVNHHLMNSPQPQNDPA